MGINVEIFGRIGETFSITRENSEIWNVNTSASTVIFPSRWRLKLDGLTHAETQTRQFKILVSVMFFLLPFCLFFTTGAVLYQCPNYKALSKTEKNAQDDGGLKCNFLMTNPKKVINPYKNDIQNYVQSKPFGSICLKCSMCLAVAKEFDDIFKELSNANKGKKQAGIVDEITQTIDALCSNGFENYDLRKFQQYQIVTDDFSCSTHVRTKMDGRWTEKLREICQNYSNYMDVQYLLNDYLKGIDDIAKYLCSNNGIFRDCSSLDFQNTSINPEQRDSAVLCK